MCQVILEKHTEHLTVILQGELILGCTSEVKEKVKNYAEENQIKNGKICVSAGQASRSFSGTEHILLTYFHQDDVGADLADFVPGDDVFLIRSEQAAEPKRPWDNQGTDTSLSLVQNQIAYFSQALAVAAVDNVFFF